MGKAGHFRKNGIPITKKVHIADLQILHDLLIEHKPEEVILLGDLFHSSHNNEWQDFITYDDEIIVNAHKKLKYFKNLKSQNNEFIKKFVNLYQHIVSIEYHKRVFIELINLKQPINQSFLKIMPKKFQQVYRMEWKQLMNIVLSHIFYLVACNVK